MNGGRAQKFDATLLAFLALAMILATPAAAQTLTGMGAYSSGATTQAATSSAGSSSDISQNPFLGSAPEGQASGQSIPLTLKDAIGRGLRYNLGLLLDADATRTAEGQRWKTLSDLLPNVKIATSEAVEPLDLAALGFSGIPGFKLPNVIGPFGVWDARAYASVPVLDLSALNRVKVASESHPDAGPLRSRSDGQHRSDSGPGGSCPG